VELGNVEVLTTEGGTTTEDLLFLVLVFAEQPPCKNHSLSKAQGEFQGEFHCLIQMIVLKVGTSAWYRLLGASGLVARHISSSSLT
jgi:hypothetical protein